MLAKSPSRPRVRRSTSPGILATLLFFCLPASFSQATNPASVEQWGIEEITLHSSTSYKDPFHDATLTATFTQQGKAIDVTGFYDGAHTWRIRFMPQTKGPWKYTTHSNDPSLNDATGAFIATTPKAGNHGPVGVSHRFHFSYADGTPYFLLGTTMYNWINRDDSLQEQTLATLAHEPFNKVRFCIFPKWYAYNRVEPQYFPFIRKADKSFDFDQFDVRYFHRLERRILQLQKLGIEADIILFHPYDHWGFDAMGQQRDIQYLDYVAARLSAFRNVWWTMANEYDLFTPSLTKFGSFTVEPRIPKDWEVLGKTLAADDPYHHLTGIHDIATWYDANAPWITHLIDQDGAHRPDLSVPMGRALYHKPVVVDEYGYEGNNGRGWGDLDARSLLKQHWELTMCGGYGSHGETFVHPNGILWWSAGGTLVGDLPARLGFLKKIMTEAPFQEMQPEPEKIMGGEALVGPRGYSLFYFEKQGEHQIKLDGSQAFRAELIDPWLMKIYPLGVVPAGIHKLTIRMIPEILRFIPVQDGDATHSKISLRDRMDQFAGELTSPPPDTPFHPERAHLSDQYTLNLILLNPDGREVIHSLLPDLKLDGINPALPLHTIAVSPANGIDAKTLDKVEKELEKVSAY